MLMALISTRGGLVGSWTIRNAREMWEQVRRLTRLPVQAKTAMACGQFLPVLCCGCEAFHKPNEEMVRLARTWGAGVFRSHLCTFSLGVHGQLRLVISAHYPLVIDSLRLSFFTHGFWFSTYTNPLVIDLLVVDFHAHLFPAPMFCAGRTITWPLPWIQTDWRWRPLSHLRDPCTPWILKKKFKNARTWARWVIGAWSGSNAEKVAYLSGCEEIQALFEKKKIRWAASVYARNLPALIMRVRKDPAGNVWR